MNKNKYNFDKILKGTVRCYPDKDGVVRQAVYQYGLRTQPRRRFSCKHYRGRTWVIRIE